MDPVTLKPDLYAAAAANDFEKVTTLLDEAVPATFIELKSGLTPLHWAAMHGNVRMLKKLLDGGASEPYHRLADKVHQMRLDETSISSASRAGSPSKGSHGAPTTNTTRRRACGCWATMSAGSRLTRSRSLRTSCRTTPIRRSRSKNTR